MTAYRSPKFRETMESLWKLQRIILDTLDFKQVTQKIVDSIVFDLDYLKLGYRIVVLAMGDNQNQVLRRISMSQTSAAKKIRTGWRMAFEDIAIPYSATENFCIKTLFDGKQRVASDWKDILSPPMTPEEARHLQEVSEVRNSIVISVQEQGKPVGILIFSLEKPVDQVRAEEHDLLQGYADIVSLSLHDATLYSKLEQTKSQLAEANEQLKILDKLKDEFVSVASHELRTPMTAIKSYLWMALAGKGGELTEKQKYYLERSYQSTERLIKLVNDMLNISRIESGRISVDVQETSLQQLLVEVISEIKPKADELNLSITYNPATDLPMVLADSDKIKEVIINIIGNALKFTSSGGSITISHEIQGDEVITHITDTGKGIDQDNIDKLFHKFGLLKDSYVTNQNASQGTGLGLYICKSIVEIQKGRIWVQSPGIDKGSTFSFSLKIYTPELFAEFEKSNQGVEGIGLIHRDI